MLAGPCLLGVGSLAERTMDELQQLCAGLGDQDLELLRRITRGMRITADLSRSDLVMYFPRSTDRIVAISQAQPRSISSVYDSSLVGKTYNAKELPAVFDALRGRRHVRTHRELYPSGAPVVQDVYPVCRPDKSVIALFSVEISLIQLERHRSRHRTFRQAIEWLKAMCMQGDLADADSLSPFGEWDGVVYVDTQRRIVYLSGIASNLYRRLGYLEDLRGKRLPFLNTKDDELVVAAIEQQRPLETESQEGSRIWIRKVLPVFGPAGLAGRVGQTLGRSRRSSEIRGVVVMVRDETEERQKKQELKVKSTMIQEVHHRVKNNLQTIAAMLRMQARRTKDEESLQAINEATSRILSVAVIHEFLSRNETQAINVRDVCQRILTQSRQVAVTPGMQISFSLDGPNIYLPSQQATACALIVNELIQNAVEHGFEKAAAGEIKVMLTDGGDDVRLEIWDDGDRLPDDFQLGSSKSLGLQIVRSLVQDDLHGTLLLENRENGVVASVCFPKQVVSHE